MRTATAGTLLKYSCVLLLAGLTQTPATLTHAAFYVDDYEVDEVGSCNVESWISFASNKDFMAATSPSCVVRIGVPVEIGAEYQRSWENSEWKAQGGFSGKGPPGEFISVTEPRFQTCFRISPASNLDVTMIYGRNLNGENASWLTLGFTVGFPSH